MKIRMNIYVKKEKQEKEDEKRIKGDKKEDIKE